MNPPNLLSTRERVKLLRGVIYNTGLLSVNKIAVATNLSKSLVSMFFKILAKEKIFGKKQNKFFVKDNLNTKAVKLLLNLSSVNPTIFREYKFVESAGIYGSFVKGNNTEDSDIDLWVLTEKTKEENLAKLTSELQRRINRGIKLLYLTREKLDALKKEDKVFYYSLFFGSITIYGEGIETI